MTAFNDFTKKFDDAINLGDVDGAAEAMITYVKTASSVTGKSLSVSFKNTRGWMAYDMGENRESSTRNTENGKRAIEQCQKSLGINLE